MSIETNTGGSVWVETGPPQPEFPELEGHVNADVAVIGGGIVGVTTALLLAESGADVALLEADRVGCGVTGYTTAKVSSQHGLIYSQLRAKHGAEGARLYGQANEEALAWIARRVDEREIDCDFRRQPSYAYLGVGADLSALHRELEAASEAGLPATFSDELPLPYPVAGAVRFDHQAEFHARKYLLALASELVEAGGAIYEGSRAVEVDMGDPSVVKSAGGRVSAGQVVVASHYPFLDRTLAFARLYPQRSYAIVCRIGGEPPAGMYISGDTPTRSLRAVPVDGDELLLVGGEGHKAGQGGDTRECYRALEEFARANWDVRSVDYRWSSQDNTTADGLPYVGPLTPFASRAYMATGFAKWGMTGGTAAALLLSDLIQGRENGFAELYDPNRFKPRAAAPKLIEENAHVALRFFGDRLGKPGVRDIDDLAPGEGDIVRHRGERVAAYRSEDGELVAVSTRCTHLGCQVNWNAAECSWDCPCHGSRFGPAGEVLQGPAVHRLERKPLG